jgi:hypothetical protein
MSLEALNSPRLIGILTAGCYGALPFVVNNPLFLSSSSATATALPWSTIKGMNVLAYGISIYSVTRPGRYDGQKPPSQQPSSSSKKKNDDDVVNVNVDGIDGSDRSLLNPAGWAFSIWGIIFIGELIMVSAPYIISTTSTTPTSLIREITGPYMMSQLFQVLWCASFRPKYGSSSAGGGGYYKYLSVLNLTGIALSLSFCHDAFTNKSATASSYSNMNYWLYFLPLSLHFGWTTAASLVNLNGMYAMRTSTDNNKNDKNNNNDNDNDNDNSITKAKSVALLGNISVVIATTVGITVTYIRNAPVYGGVICWALTAVSFGLKKRLLLNNDNNYNSSASSSSNNRNKVGLYGAKTQQTLCQIGAIACAITSTFVVAFSGRGS